VLWAEVAVAVVCLGRVFDRSEPSAD
jgi:hypothetical protein